MSQEARAALDLRGLAGRFADALQAVGFDFERPSLATALRGYQEWLRTPVEGLEWGETDCARVFMEPILGSGTYEIELARYVGEEGNEHSVELYLVFLVDATPGLAGLWGTDAEAFDDPPEVWIRGGLRHERAIKAALAHDRPVGAQLRINCVPVR